MIARIWRGAVRREDGDAYASYMQATGIAGYARTPGNQAVLMLRRDVGDRCEFLMLSLWDSRTAVTAFAGPAPDKAVFYPEDDRYLVERDLTVRHYEVDTAVLDPAIGYRSPPPGRGGTLEPPGPPSRSSVLHGRAVRLRPVTPDDAVRLAEILAHPEVARWWGRFDLDRVHRELVAPDDGTVPFAIEADGQLIGLIQYWEEPEPDYCHAAVDLFLGPAWHGRGLGADALRTLARHLFQERGHHRLTIDPAAHNQRAIRSYERVGFRPVGVMRRYERGPDGTWHDGLLMDLLPEDLT